MKPLNDASIKVVVEVPCVWCNGTGYAASLAAFLYLVAEPQCADCAHCEGTGLAYVTDVTERRTLIV